MPILIKTIDEIMHERRRDTYFVRFSLGAMYFDTLDPQVRRGQLAWFDAHDLAFETAAPRDWLEGDPRCYAIYFDGPDDPRLSEYSQLFEDVSGRSLKPQEYQMYLQLYEHWLRRGGEQRLLHSQNEEDL